MTVMLKVDYQQKGSVAVLRCSGNMELEDDGVKLHDEIAKLIGKGFREILINMGHVIRIIPKRKTKLVSILLNAVQQRCVVGVHNPNNGLCLAFQITGVDRVCTVTFGDEALAIAKFPSMR